MRFKTWFIKKAQKWLAIVGVSEIREQINESKFLSAQLLIRQIKNQGVMKRLSDAEFKVFSQFGDDGIIQYLLQQVDIPENARKFIEFGVQDYQESNTRFLLINNNWSGLILDGSPSNIEKVVSDAQFWRHDLTAVAAFIDRDNVNDLFNCNGFQGEIGLLSVDIDGNDYWVWESINVVNPIIVICEYNSTFGSEHAITVPYDPVFQRGVAHFSNLYWGVSLKALCFLAKRRGYAFVGCNSAGNNAYFVRTDKLGNLSPVDCAQGYVESKFRESRSRDGKLTYLTASARLKEIADLPAFNVESQTIETISNVFKILIPASEIVDVLSVFTGVWKNESRNY